MKYDLEMTGRRELKMGWNQTYQESVVNWNIDKNIVGCIFQYLLLLFNLRRLLLCFTECK